jgi:dihydropteroate synthase-like protein
VKILLVTGSQACKLVEEYAEKVMREERGVELYTLCLPIPVAAMMTVEYLERELSRRINEVKQFDLIMVPGLTRGDLSGLSSKLGVKLVKGPRYIDELHLAVKAILSGLELSPRDPADVLIGAYRRELEDRALVEARLDAERSSWFTIGGVPISPSYPAIMLEVYAEEPEDLDRYQRAVAYADLVSIGVSSEIDLSKAINLIEQARAKFKKPVGVDAADLKLIERLAKLVDFVNGISVDQAQDLLQLRDSLHDKPIVIVGRPLEPRVTVEGLVEAARSLRSMGFTKIILDPVLAPPLQGLVKSIEAYATIKRLVDAPVLMGVGNVTELVDVDSVGVNALLAFMGVELGVEIFLTTESSTKTRGSTRELRVALEMAIVAKRLGRPPKDLSRSLLFLKSKRPATTTMEKARETIYSDERPKWTPDPKGYFKIYVDHSKGEIVVQHYNYSSKAPTLEVRSRDPYAIINVLLSRGLVSSQVHIFYLGVELSKAKIALDLGREYEQDKELFEVETS